MIRRVLPVFNRSAMEQIIPTNQLGAASLAAKSEMLKQ